MSTNFKRGTIIPNNLQPGEPFFDGLKLYVGDLDQTKPAILLTPQSEGELNDFLSDFNVYTGITDDRLILLEEENDNVLTTSGGTITGSLIINENLYVHGSEVIMNSETLEVEDNIILLNNNEVGLGVTSGFSGVKIERGQLIDYGFMFDEVRDTFVIGEMSGETSEAVSNLQIVATREDNPVDGGFSYWDVADLIFKTTTISSSNLTDNVNVTKYSDENKEFIGTGTTIFNGPISSSGATSDNELVLLSQLKDYSGFNIKTITNNYNILPTDGTIIVDGSSNSINVNEYIYKYESIPVQSDGNNWVVK
jgi:hypothetical protein